MTDKFKIVLGIGFSVFFYYVAFSQDQIPRVYKFSEDIVKGTSFNQMASHELSCIRDYAATLEMWDKDEDKPLSLSVKEKQDYSKYKPMNAVQFIINRSKTEQVIIINEAHHQPYHRVFTTHILKGLYENGFRYLCVEALGEDEYMHSRKFPIINTGGYIREPFFGNLIRVALGLGFTLVPYEDTKNSGYDSKGNNLREIEQANNIKKILDKDSNAKILVHCGFGHIKEGTVPGWGKAMAGRLIEYTGINPFTIDQVSMTEHSKQEFEDPYFKEDSFLNYTILVDSTGKLFNGPETNNQYDLRVILPRTNYIHGRPHWVFENQRIPYFLEKMEISYPCLVYAYLEDEKLHDYNPYENPVPFDIIELKSGNDKLALSLKKGVFKIIIEDFKGIKKEVKVSLN